jgi:CxxC motif-containing protein
VRLVPKESEVICVVCPLACRVTVSIDDKGNVVNVTDNQCKEGGKYAINEYKFPGRVLTTTVLTESSGCKLLSVRSNKLIPKDRLRECAHFLAKVRVKPPVKIGQIIVTNIVGTGVDMLSTNELLR